jgi:hypothetical protein
MTHSGQEFENLSLEGLKALASERGLTGVEQLGRGELIARLERIAPSLGDRRASPPPAPPSPLVRFGGADGTLDLPSSTLHAHGAPGDRPPATPTGERHTPPPPSEPMGMLDLEELPETYGTDECEVLYKDPHWLFAYWEVTDTGLGAARAQLGPDGGAARLVLRLFTTTTAGARLVNDIDLHWNHGRRYLQNHHPGAQLRIAVGLLSSEGYFAPIAHSSLIRVPPAGPGPIGPVEWLEVRYGSTRGKERERVQIVTRDAPHNERGIAGAGSAGMAPSSQGGAPNGGGLGGASERRPPRGKEGS